jgi:hypothetical protein
MPMITNYEKWRKKSNPSIISIYVIDTKRSQRAYLFILSRFRGLRMTYKTGSGLDDWIYWHLIHTTRNYRQLQSSRWSTNVRVYRYTLSLSLSLGFSAFTSRNQAGDLYQSHCNFKTHVKSSCHRLIPFLPLSCTFKLRRLYWQAGISKLDSVLLNWTLLYNHFARSKQKIQALHCWGGGFTKPLHSSGSYSIAAFVSLPREYVYWVVA